MTLRKVLPTVAVATAALSLVALPGCIVVVHDHNGDSDVQISDWTHPHIGVELDSVDRATAAQLQVDRDHACVVTHVHTGGPADKAGLRKYDIITHIDGATNASISSVRSAIRARKDGELLKLTVLREGKPLDLEITVED